MKSARGRLHAEALRGLAETALAEGDSARAIACFQRIYTLYQAYDDLVAEAWFRSAGLFEERGDLAAAYKSYRELSENERLQDSVYLEPARRARDRLAPSITETEEPSI
jgi:tetratricopeptide (TPR) repeat protein